MISPAWIIQKKRDGKELTRDEIRFFVAGLASGEVADYQATAWLMAVFFRGMTLGETVALTEAMVESGDRYNLKSVVGHKVDKHSTGGVGDKVSIILSPLAAACGLKVPMMSGRGLGHTGGTLDKLQSIPGFRVDLSEQEFVKTLQTLGCAMIGQSAKIAPADKKLYALRDVTATVECIPLIVASILSKKIAEGTDSLVLDIKVGSGAFMKTKKQGKRLAKTLSQVAKKMGLPCRALLTDMSQPLGYAVGNSLEIKECIEILRNEKSSEASSCDLKELTLILCAHMLELSGQVKTLAQGRKLAQQKLQDGSAWNIFLKLVKIQGGSVDAVENPSLLPISKNLIQVKAKKRGYLTHMDTEGVGKILIELGGGRRKASDVVDPSTGIIFHRKLGSRVQIGDPVATIYAPLGADGDALTHKLLDTLTFSGTRKALAKLVLELI